MSNVYIKDGWTISAVFISLIVLIPVISIFLYLFYPSGDIWLHLIDTVLYDYVANSLILVFFVGLSTAIVGVSTAWVVTMFDKIFWPFKTAADVSSQDDSIPRIIGALFIKII